MELLTNDIFSDLSRLKNQSEDQLKAELKQTLYLMHAYVHEDGPYSVLIALQAYLHQLIGR